MHQVAVVHGVVPDLEQLRMSFDHGEDLPPDGGLAHGAGGKDRGAHLVGYQEVHDLQRRIKATTHVEGQGHLRTCAGNGPIDGARCCGGAVAGVAGRDRRCRGSDRRGRDRRDSRLIGNDQLPTNEERPRVGDERGVARAVPGLELRDARAKATGDRGERITSEDRVDRRPGRIDWRGALRRRRGGGGRGGTGRVAPDRSLRRVNARRGLAGTGTQHHREREEEAGQPAARDGHRVRP